MSDKKNIDRLFQERFKNFEASPSHAVWNRIETQLQQKNKKRRVIPIWWRYAGAAALLLLLLTIGNTFFGEPTQVIPVNQVVENEDNTRNNEASKNKATELQNTNAVAADANTNSNNTGVTDSKNASEDIIISKAATIADTASDTNETENTSNISSKQVSNSLIKPENSMATAAHSESYDGQPVEGNRSKNNNGGVQNNESKANSHPKEFLDTKTTENNIAITENPDKENNNNLEKGASLDKTKTDAVINNIKKNNTAVAETKGTESKDEKKTPTIEDILNDTNNINEEEERLNRWSVTPNAAPVYFNTLGEGSSIDGQFNNNTKTAEANMSYGITASYAVNKKLSIRSGINKVNLGYNTNNVVVYETLSKSSSSSILGAVSTVKTASKNTNTPDNVALVSAENFESNKGASLTSNSNTSINQSFAYIEVPLEIQYTLSDKKLGINLIGGFSSFFLNDNELFSEVEGARTSIGEATNINNVSYSANFGLGFQYKFTKKLNLNLEPMFKYQINTFNNTSGNFTPYFIGFYTGIGFKF